MTANMCLFFQTEVVKGSLRSIMNFPTCDGIEITLDRVKRYEFQLQNSP